PKLRHGPRRLTTRQVAADLTAGLCALAITGACFMWVVSRAVRGLDTLGEVGLFYQAFSQGLRLMRSLLENVGQLYANTLFLGNLFEFLSLTPQVVSPPSPRPVPASPGIRFDQVCFRYPGGARVALDRFDLFVPAGRIVAI